MDDSLLKELSHPDPDRRVEAAWRLGEICNPAEKVVAALKMTLFDEELSVRGAAAEALGRIGCGNTEAGPPIIELLGRETDEMGRARCVFALGRAGSSAARAVPVLLEILRTDDTHVYDTALWALSEIGDYSRAVVEAITKGLKRCLSDQRWVAAKALGRIGSAASLSVPALIESLEDVHPLIRELSAWALGEIGIGRSTAPLTLLAERDPCPEVCYRAKSAMNLILGPQVEDQENRPGGGKDLPFEDTADRYNPNFPAPCSGHPNPDHPGWLPERGLPPHQDSQFEPEPKWHGSELRGCCAHSRHIPPTASLNRAAPSAPSGPINPQPNPEKVGFHEAHDRAEAPMPRRHPENALLFWQQQ